MWREPILIRLTESAFYASGSKKRGLFRCSCGGEFVTNLASVKRGLTRSCGCLHGKVMKERIKHGEAARGKWTVEYATWARMLDRCYNPKTPYYAIYGGKGITVCPEWRNSYETFLAYVGRRPANKTSIDRIDSMKGYEPGNVRWATAHEQNRNKSSNVYVEHNGERLCLLDYCRATGRNIHTVRHRLNWRRWPLSRALEAVDGRRK